MDQKQVRITSNYACWKMEKSATEVMALFMQEGYGDDKVSLRLMEINA